MNKLDLLQENLSTWEFMLCCSYKLYTYTVLNYTVPFIEKLLAFTLFLINIIRYKRNINTLNAKQWPRYKLWQKINNLLTKVKSHRGRSILH